MKIELRYAEFHAPVFSSGKNFGTKLDAKKCNVRLFLDTETDMITMVYNGNVSWYQTWQEVQPLDQNKYLTEVTPADMEPPRPLAVTNRGPGRPRVREVQGEQ